MQGRRATAGAAITLVLVAAAPVAGGAARTHPGARRVLATGDSMIQYVDVALARRLRSHRIKVRSDAHVGTGLSKSFLLDWVRHSRKEAARVRPRATVVFLGANEGFPLRHHRHRVNCCSQAWGVAYAGRVRAMMRALERDGRNRVYWLTLPAARPRNWAKIYRRVNAGIRIAGREESANGVRVLDMGRVFTPHHRFQASIVRGGRRIVVRQADGIHLNPAGASIAAGVVERALRRDGELR